MRRWVLLLGLLVASSARATLPSTTSRVDAVGNGSTTVFSFAIKTASSSWVEVYLAGVKQSSGYTVALNANQATSPGGAVTFTTAPATGVAVRIQRVVPLTQDSAWTAYNYRAATLEGVLDRLVAQDQQLDRDRADLAVRTTTLETEYQLATGPQGATGAQGPQGSQGTAGVPGTYAAAMEIAVANWTTTSVALKQWMDLAWTGTRLVGVGYGSAAVTSDDNGATWTSRTIPTCNYGGLAWNGTMLVAVGGGCISTSADGITWTARTVPEGITAYNDVAWNGSVFAAVGSICAATSPDGITWTDRATTTQLEAVTWTGTYFVAVGPGEAATSTDGTSWTPRTIPAGWYHAVTWNGSAVVAVGEPDGGVGTAVISTSPTGVTWTERADPVTAGGAYQNVAALYGGVLVALDIAGHMPVSIDSGATWRDHTQTGATGGVLGTDGERLLALTWNSFAARSQKF